MTQVERLVDATYMDNTLWQLAVGASVAVGAFLVLLLIRRFVRSRYAKLAATPQTELLELPLRIASHTSPLFLLIASLFIGVQWLTVPPAAGRAILTMFTIAVFWQIGLWASIAVVSALERKQRATLATDAAAASSLGVIGFLARATIWSFVLLLTLDNLGIQIKPLLAGLGIGGIAVALAAQNILGDLFASLSITLDRPFVVGDSLQVDEFNGTVEYIGVKSTRLRSLSGEQIIMPNANLLSSRVRNNSRMNQRRVVINISVDQQTPVHAVAGNPRPHSRADRRTPAAAFRPLAFRQDRRGLIRLRGRVHPADAGLRQAHGHPAGHQPQAGGMVRRAGHRVLDAATRVLRGSAHSRWSRRWWATARTPRPLLQRAER